MRYPSNQDRQFNSTRITASWIDLNLTETITKLSDYMGDDNIYRVPLFFNLFLLDMALVY